MARQKDIKLDNGSWLLLGIEPDWDRINELAQKVDDGDLSVLDELIDLIIYE
jgi:oligoribonuclease (3'-5' exoribonuclease)